MKSIPQGFSTLTPTLVVNGALKAIELYKKAFDAKELYCMKTPAGDKVMHACLEIGSSKLFICDTDPKMGCASPTVSSFYAYMDDVDASFKKAKSAGLNELFPVNDMFWGDRTGSLEDAFGIRWTIATHVRDVSEDEMEEAKKSWGKAA